MSQMLFGDMCLYPKVMHALHTLFSFLIANEQNVVQNKPKISLVVLKKEV